ncbi:MAG TPA: hypothetical protein VFG86_11920 [Chloroflexota bacterium]|jgi:hypothetical protein|nr:hypothetical protein [Chloroflexota bacterium]
MKARLEGVDNAAPLHSVYLPRSSQVKPVAADGMVTLRTAGLAIDPGDWDGQLYRAGQPPSERDLPLVAVPYAMWGNRPAGEMRVWIREAAWPAVG